MYNISSSSPLQLLYHNLCAAYSFYFKVTTVGCISAALSVQTCFRSTTPHPEKNAFPLVGNTSAT